MLLFAWISILIHVFGDLFRDRSLSGGAKALWTVLLVFLPWVGVLIYLIIRGRSMNQRAVQATEAQEASVRAYVRDAAGSPGPLTSCAS